MKFLTDVIYIQKSFTEVFTISETCSNIPMFRYLRNMYDARSSQDNSIC